MRRAEQERDIVVFVDEAQRLLSGRSPGSIVAVWSEILEVDVLLGVRRRHGAWLGPFGYFDILAAAGDDPLAAARQWAGTVIDSWHRREGEMASVR